MNVIVLSFKVKKYLYVYYDGFTILLSMCNKLKSSPFVALI